VCVCALTHSKFDHSRHQRIILLLFIIRILNSKYLNTDDDEGERGSKHTHIYTGETPSAFFKQHQERKRERTIYTKLYQTEGRKKSGYFDKILLNWLKKKKE